MTTAGNIHLGVEIDASDLRSELTQAVIEEMGPFLAQMNAELRKSAKGQNDLGTAIDRNVPRQRRQKTATDNLTAATASLTARQNEFNAAQELFGRRSPEAESAFRRLTSAQRTHTEAITRAAAASRNSTDSQISDWRRLAAEAEASRRAQESAFDSIDRSRRKMGGGGGGRFSGLGGPGGMTLGGLGAQALGPALLGVTNLTGALVQLSQAGLALPGIFAGGAASIGTAVIGFQGMGDAIKAINKGMAEGASKADAKKMAAALKDMDDNAKAVALTIATDFIPEFKKLQSEVVQHNMFDGIATSLTGLRDKALPVFRRGLDGMSKAWNDTFKRITGAAGDSTNLSLVDRIFGNSAEGQKRANQAIEPITRAMLQLSSVGSEFLPRLGDGITKLTTRFGDWVNKNVASGQMWKWIDEGLNGFRALGNSVLNVGKMITGLTKAAGGDGGFLGWLEKATGRWQKFINSTEGQNKIGKFFDEARDSWKQWSPILSDVVKLAGDVIEGFKNWGAVILPVIGSITHALAQLPNLITAAVTAFAGFKTLSGLSSLIGLTGPNSARNGGRTGMLGRFINPAMLLGGGALGLGVGTHQDARTGPGALLGAGETIGGAALLGAGIGSIIPGVGTGIGAGIGALAGSAIAIYDEAVRRSGETARAAADAQQRLADAQEHAAATSETARDTNKDINRALINSGGKIDASTLAGVTDAINLIPDQLKDQIGPDAQKAVGDLLKNMSVRPDQLAQQVLGSQGVFDALITQLNGQGGAGGNLATALSGLRSRTLGQADAAAAGNPLLQANAGETGRTLDMVANDLHTLIAGQGQGREFNINSPGGADLLKQLQQAGLPVNAGAGGAITGSLTPDQFKQLAAASGVPVIAMPGGGIGIPAAIPAGPNLQALPNPQQQGLMNLAAAAGANVTPPVGAPTIGPALGGPVPVQIVGTPLNPNPLGGLAAAAAGPALSGPPPDLGQQTGVKDLTTLIAGIPPAKIDVQAPDVPKAQQDLKGIWDQISDVNKTPLTVKADTSQADQAIKSLFASFQSRTLTIPVTASASGTAPLGPPRADGGLMPGYSPGRDTMLAPMSGGEGVIIPEAMRALGGGWLYNLNSSFRPGISRRGYATGGVVGLGDGVSPDPLGDNSVIGLLTQIRDALIGRGSSALATTADNTTQMAQALGPKMKPFGGDVAKGALAGMIKGLGGDPNLMDWGGFNGNGDMLVPRGGGVAGMPGAGPNMGALAQMLQAFARSGNTADLGMGLSTTSPVVRAIVSARNKKTGMSDDAIAGLVGQVLTGGGYSGVLDSSNTSLINALTTFQQDRKSVV